MAAGGREPAVCEASAVNFALEPSSHDEELDALGLEPLAQDFDRFVDFDGPAAIEQIHGSVAVLGPGVDRVVRFLDDHRAGDAIGFELVEALGDDGGFAFHGGIAHRVADAAFLFEGALIAAVKFDQQVGSERRLFAGFGGEPFFVAAEPAGELLLIVTSNEGPAFVANDGGGGLARDGLFAKKSRDAGPKPGARLKDDRRKGGAAKKDENCRQSR